MRSFRALPVFFALLAAASTARAQAPDSTPLYTLRGDPIPYRIDVPEGWPVSRAEFAQSGGDKTGYMLTVGDRVVVKLYTLDIVSARETGPSEALRRRLVTQMILRSDSLIYAMMDGSGGAEAQQAQMRVEAREIRILRGQRAGFMSARFDVDGTPGWMEMHVTLSEGILYVLSFATLDEDPAPYAPLFARVRDSLVFAPAPDDGRRR